MSVPFPRPLKLGDQGIDVEGVGRALCKTGFYVTLKEFQNADEEWRRTFGQRKVDAVNKVRLQAGWKRTGTYNEAVKDKLEAKGYFDARAISLIKAWKPPPAPKEPQIRAAMTDFCIRAEAVEERWTYNQRRPFTGIGDAPERQHTGDCSAYCVLVYAHAKEVTSLDVRDPSGYNYSGYGNTWDDLDGHGRVGSGFLIGDLAHWEGHVAICRKAGTRSTSVWSSFGSERGPLPVSLDYRSDFRFVVRPPILGS